MLDYMRKSSNSLLMYILFGALAAVFAFSFGPGSSGFATAGGQDYAAIVDGEVIPAARYQQAYVRERDAINRRFAGAGAGFNTDFLLNGLSERVIDGLIARVLLKQEGERLGLVVSEDELSEWMSENVFSSEDVTPQVYRDWLRGNYNMTPEEYEADLRATLLGEKVRKTIEAGVSVSDEELRAAYLLENNRAKATFVRFDTRSVADIDAPSESEIDAAIANERSALEERYNKDIFKYRNPEQRQVRQILKALPADADDVAVAKLRAELVGLKEQLEGGADFAALAATASEDEASKGKGGDLGFVQRGTLARELESAIFSLAKDQISDPIKTPRGLHLVQLVEIQASSNKPLDEVIRDVAVSYLQDAKKLEVAKGSAEALLTKLQAGESLETLTVTEEEKRGDEEANKNALVRVTSPWILKTQDSIPRLGQVEGLVDELFTMDAETPVLQRVVESNNAYFVLALDERETPDLEKFEEEKSALRETEISKKRTRVVTDWIEHLREDAVIEFNPALFDAEVKDGASA